MGHNDKKAKRVQMSPLVITGFIKKENGTYVRATRIYTRECVPDKPGDSDRPPGILVTLQRMIIHGRYVPVKRREKHQCVWFDPNDIRPTYLRRVA
jgi:hypothetical protein